MKCSSATLELVGVDPNLLKEATFTKRTIRCIPDAGWELGHETRENLVAMVRV